MNKERFYAANIMALVTHTLVSSINKLNLSPDPTFGHGKNQITNASRG